MVCCRLIPRQNVPPPSPTMASVCSNAQGAVFTGTIKSIDFVNPHFYLYLDADTAEGGSIAMR